MRVVVPGDIGARSVTWVTGITASAEPSANDVQATAYAGDDRSVARVDVPHDGGTTWPQAVLEQDEGPWAWCLRRIDVELPAGAAHLVVRARDGTGASPPESPVLLWNPQGYVKPLLAPSGSRGDPVTTWGLIGSGHIGSAVARLAVAAGHDVVLSNSRGPETLSDLVDELGPHARAATSAEAAQAGDVVVVTIPFKAYRSVPVDPLVGKVVIDTNNYYPARDDHFPELDDGSTTSSELLQQHLPQSHVVKALNNINFTHLAELARRAGSTDRSALLVAGDDAAAKQLVTGLFDRLGYDTLDAGPLREGRRFQPDTPAYGLPYFAPDADLSKVDAARGIMPPSSPTTAADLAASLAAFSD